MVIQQTALSRYLATTIQTGLIYLKLANFAFPHDRAIIKMQSGKPRHKMTIIILLILGIGLAKPASLRLVEAACDSHAAIGVYSHIAEGKRALDALTNLHTAISHPPQGWAAP